VKSVVLKYVITEWSENPVTVTDFQMDGRSSEYRLRLSSIASTMTLRHSLVLTRQHANISRRDSRMSKFESWTQHREHVPANNILQLAPWPGQHLSRYGVFPVQPHCANARRNRWQEDLRPQDALVLRWWRLSSKTWNPTTLPEWSNWRGSESSTLETQVQKFKFKLIFSSAPTTIRTQVHYNCHKKRCHMQSNAREK